MIFLTVGTQLPFDRLVRAVDEWCVGRPEARVLGQILEPGADGYRPQNFEWKPSLDPEAYQRAFAEAEFVIAHAGMGSILTAMTLMKPLVIMARRADLREQRNDHQLATVERFRATPGIHAAGDEQALPGVLDRIAGAGAGPAPTGISPFASPLLIEALRVFIRG